MPEVSIVLPVYNGEKYISEAINSIINQTFTDWELIIVNDCSTDSTSEIVNEYAKSDKRIRVLENDSNFRLPKSLNRGFSEARGEFLTWTSDDNKFFYNAIEIMYKSITANIDVGLVCADMDIVDECGMKIKNFESYIVNDLCVENTIGACFLYRREILDTIGEYDESLFLVEDYDYWIRIEEKYNIYHIDEVLYAYRVHDKSLSKTKQKQVLELLHQLREKHIDYIMHKIGGDFYKCGRLFCEDYILGYKESLLNKIIIKKYYEYQVFMNSKNESDEIVIFGAGSVGKKCLEEQAGKKVLFFVDNAADKIDSEINTIKVKSVEVLANINENVCVIIAIGNEKKPFAIRQLYQLGVRNMELF